ncbi:T9SS type A sorting domain-containing protein [Bizionia myxarmorum]|uniref:T9SS type A sorting domain-containing protein n=1 Tax=Bizionia myxarmorum TaxID=291186 RepID=A0A5D0RGI9_9FLAO|nr:T9SS type A sorting domain-containing protein [Bizionia myxarmorum]TYB79828.1 T9SS type A sorting domain-containing protein [Bizionia myxarmorum]
MKYIYLIIIISVSNLILGQTDLHVGGNSYVYVDGTIFNSSPAEAPIYVSNSINLNAANSYVYLRNEAQLLQGNDVKNSGIGKVSVYQSGTVNTYAYNYWSSPVGNTAANDLANRPFIPNNNIYDHIGNVNPALAPITSVLATYTSGYNGTPTAAPIPQVISSFWLYTYNPGILYTDWDTLGAGGSVNSGYGFTMKGNSSESQQYDFRGKANNGTFTVNVGNGLETLVGNPYPSALDARDFIHDPANIGLITGVLKYWEQAPGATSHVLSNYVGGYATYTVYLDGTDSFTYAPFTTYLADGTATNFPAGIYGTKIPQRYIPIGQGFMIEGITTGSVTFNNAQREFYKQSGPRSYFFRNEDDNSDNTSEETTYTEEGLNIVPADFKRFRINVDFTENELYTRQLLMNFHNSATDGFDYGLEGKGDTPLASDAYWILDNQPYVIQAFSYNQALQIPLVVKARANQPIRFRIYDVQNFDDSQPIYIHDIQNNIYVNLRNQHYEINLPQGVYTDRFEITFAAQTLSNPDFAASDFTIFQNNQNSELTLINPKQLAIKQLSVFDVSGKRVLNLKKLPLSEKQMFSTKQFSDGMYVVSLEFEAGNSLTKKVIVSNKK